MASGERRRQGKLGRRLKLNLVGGSMRGSMLQLREGEENGVAEEHVDGKR